VLQGRPTLEEAQDPDKEWLCANCMDVWEVEGIRSDKQASGGKQYLIKWVGSDVLTWEKACDILAPELVNQYEATNSNKRSRRSARGS
jgi:hypothetical protein